MLHIYILNTHLCTFWHKFSFLQGVLGKRGSIIEGWGLGAVSFPWMPCAEGEGCGTNNRAPPPTPPPNTSAHACAPPLSVAIVGDGGGIKEGSQQWADKLIGRPKSPGHEEREGRRHFGTSSSGPKTGPELHYLLSGGGQELMDEKKDKGRVL